MADQKETDKQVVEMNASYQYPTRRTPAPSSEPKPMDKSVPAIGTPSEALLPFTDSDWPMFERIRARYGDRLDVFYPDDTTRFVQGYSHEKERDIETFKRIDEFLKRGYESHADEWDFRTLLDTPMAGNEEEDSLKTWPVFMYGYDNEGHPVMYDEIGNCNPADLDACFEGQIRKLRTVRFRILRRLHNNKRIQTMRYSYDGSVNDKGGFNAITKHVIVMDMHNFYAKCLTKKYRNLIQMVIGDESNLWPNTLEKMYIVNAPWPFRFAWKILANFVHPITVKKIDILGSDYISTMQQKIPLDQIPPKYGGKGKWPIKLGYVADVDNDIIDGDYCTVPDPINFDTVPCKKNQSQKQAPPNHDNEEKHDDSDANKAKENNDNENEDEDDKDKDTPKDKQETQQDDSFVQVNKEEVAK